MPHKYRFKRPRAAPMSVFPVVWLTEDTVRKFNEIGRQWPGRIERGRQLFLLEMAKFLRAEVQKNAPEVAGVAYAQMLKIALVNGIRDMDVVAVYFEATTRKIDFEQEANTVLYFTSQQGSPGWVDILTRYGPWPVDLVPVVPDPNEARVVARAVRSDEVGRLTTRILRMKAQIESDLRRAGANGVEVVSSRRSEGLEVHDDIGYTVLRKEFGYMGKAESHWRPALKALLKHVPVVLKKYADFIVDGKEFRFDLPGDHFELTKNQLKSGAKFQETLAPFVR